MEGVDRSDSSSAMTVRIRGDVEIEIRRDLLSKSLP
jgi:hypothetical protein